MTASRGNMQLNVGSKPWQWPDIPHIHRVLPLSEAREGRSMWQNYDDIPTY